VAQMNRLDPNEKDRKLNDRCLGLIEVCDSRSEVSQRKFLGGWMSEGGIFGDGIHVFKGYPRLYQDGKRCPRTGKAEV